MSSIMVEVQLYFKTSSGYLLIPEKYLYPRYLVFLADSVPDCLFVTCRKKYGCRQFCNTLDRR